MTESYVQLLGGLHGHVNEADKKSFTFPSDAKAKEFAAQFPPKLVSISKKVVMVDITKTKLDVYGIARRYGGKM